MVGLLTVGHSTADAAAFVSVLLSAGVDNLVVVRSFPGSRRYPHFGREQMEIWVPAAGISYSRKRNLGGRRHTHVDSPNTGLRHPSFRSYADWMATEQFAAALDAVLEQARRTTTAIMCAEALWWRSHRRLISDAAVLHGADVQHLSHLGGLTPHQPADCVRVAGDHVVYE